MRARRGRLLLAVASVLLVVSAVFAVRFLDRMALAYTTGLRRSPQAPLFGETIPLGGPVPGALFLGRSSSAATGGGTAEAASGFVLRRASDAARDIGLMDGDRILTVGGEAYSSARRAMAGVARTRRAGERIVVRALRDGEPIAAPIRLGPFVRNPADVGLAFRDVEFPSPSGHQIRGWWIPPPKDSDGRAVVWVHGAHSSRYQALDHGAEFLHERGYGVLTMDLSGRGSSDGAYITYTRDERHDVRAAVEWVRARDPEAARRVVVFGTSNGAASAIYAAAVISDLAAVALDAPYGDLWEAAGSMLEARGGMAWLRSPLSWIVWWRAGYWIGDVRPLDVITEIPAPVLFVHGDRDVQVPPSHSEAMHEAREAAGLPSRRWVIEGGEHGFDRYPPKGVFWNRIADFFDDALGGRPPGRELGGPAPDTLTDPKWTRPGR